MDETMKQHLEKFLILCYGRLDQGEKIHGKNYEAADLYQQMSEELADVFNYAFLEYVKIQNLKIMKEKLTDKN